MKLFGISICVCVFKHTNTVYKCVYIYIGCMYDVCNVCMHIAVYMCWVIIGIVFVCAFKHINTVHTVEKTL